jgi:hypothetical protein
VEGANSRDNSLVGSTTRPHNAPVQREFVTALRPSFGPLDSPRSLYQLDDPAEPFIKALDLRLQAAHVRFNQSSVLVKLLHAVSGQFLIRAIHQDGQQSDENYRKAHDDPRQKRRMAILLCTLCRVHNAGATDQHERKYETLHKVPHRPNFHSSLIVGLPRESKISSAKMSVILLIVVDLLDISLSVRIGPKPARPRVQYSR